MSATTAPTFRMGGKRWEVYGRQTPEGFLIMKGSRANRITASFRKNPIYYTLRIGLQDEGIIEDSVFTRDFVFENATQAGSVVASRPISVSRDWITPDGMLYGDVYPKRRGEARNTEAAVREHEPVRPAGREGRMYDGTPFYVYDTEEFEVEWRGNVPFYVRMAN